MKKLLLLAFPLVLFASNSAVLEKIKELEKEIQELKRQVQQNTTNTEEDTLILEKVETKSILDKINFSPEILLRLDQFNYNNKSIEGETNSDRTGYSKHYDVAASMRFRLNMDFALDDVKFHGRMLYMNSTQSNQRICILSRNISTGTAGSAFDIDRAYVDYTFNKTSINRPTTFSFGLLPTSGGTPMQYAQNKKRSSLFPALVFDMNTYGIIGTQKLSEDTFARLVLAKPYTLRPNFYPYQCNRENIDNANIIGLYTDTKLDSLANSLLSFGINIMNDLKAHPYLGPNITPANSNILGTMVTYGAGIDMEKVAHTNTTIFTHLAFTTPYPNGQKDDYRDGFTTQNYAEGTMLQKNSYAAYLGTKYDLNQDLKFGAEFNYGSKYWFSGTQGAEDMYNKLALRGKAYELYVIWQFHKYLNAKFGYLNMEEEYTGSGWHFGEPAKKDATQSIGYMSLEARF